MSKSDMRILVVEKNALFGDDFFEGFRAHDKVDYESRILANLKIMRRGNTSENLNHPEGNAEMNPNYKQPIGYILIVNPQIKKVFAYQRAVKDEHYGEKRLQRKWSWGIGGHIEAKDSKGNPLRESMLREMDEEVHIDGTILRTRILGYINDESNSVGQVHFGIVYLAEINGIAKPKDKEMAQGEMLSLSELEQICSLKESSVENWSKILLIPLKNYFQ